MIVKFSEKDEEVVNLKEMVSVKKFINGNEI